MAKISARGATEVRRFKSNRGVTYVLRSDGAVLRKLLPGDGFAVIARSYTPGRFQALESIHRRS